MCETLDLIDIWRLKNANITTFTRQERTCFGFSQSRIDYFLISSHLQYHLCKTDIVPSIKSDHSLLLPIFDIEVENKHGRGLWKLNTGLLLDNEYVNVIKDTINIAKLDAQNLQNKNLVYDFIKCRIRTESITFAIRKHMCSNKLLKTLSNRLAELEELVSTQATLDYLDEINRTKSKIENIYNERARGCIIRTRSKFTEEYEKPSFSLILKRQTAIKSTFVL